MERSQERQQNPKVRALRFYLTHHHLNQQICKAPFSYHSAHITIINSTRMSMRSICLTFSALSHNNYNGDHDIDEFVFNPSLAKRREIGTNISRSLANNSSSSTRRRNSVLR
eukprot:GEZU01001181.1.p1 GENE.GEZU01001181.1~~GEZU01001181.1.p1  ORF type:complete len:112 (+),score=11.67 GEZU01001181.1:255-590(+)